MDTQILTRLQEVLRESLKVANEFGELLFKEKKQLTSPQREEITALLPRKEELINQLAEHQQYILDFCTQQKIDPSYSGLRSFVYRQGITNAESILNDWTQLKNELVKNQALNKTNEAILNELIKRNQIKQQIVHNLGKQTDTYSSQGQQNSYSAHGWVEQV